MTTPDREFTFQFTHPEAEYVIQLLGRQPYQEVAEMISKMQRQYDSQVHLPQEPLPVETEEEKVEIKAAVVEESKQETVHQEPPRRTPADVVETVKIGAHDKSVPKSQNIEIGDLMPAQAPGE